MTAPAQRQRLCLSPLALPTDATESTLLAGPWCINRHTIDALQRSGSNFRVVPTRVLSKDAYAQEAATCFALYNTYVTVLARELNRIHGTSYSDRYWSTLLYRFLYPLIASVMDKFYLLDSVAAERSDLIADTVDVRENWISPHTVPAFGSSRIMHFLLFSLILDATHLMPSHVVDSAPVRAAMDRIGDGKKDLKSKQTSAISMRIKMIRLLKKRLGWLGGVRKAWNGQLPLWMSRVVNPTVVPLGNQYLSPTDLKELLLNAGARPYFYTAQDWDVSAYSNPDFEMRKKLNLSAGDTLLNRAITESLRVLLPTVFLENYTLARKRTQRIVPKKKTVILNSQNSGGREIVDFYIAHAVEEHGAHHMMVCHGGNIGVMEVSVQDQVWAQIANSHALWSNPKSYGPGCEFFKMPSLRFHKWQGFRAAKPAGDDILMFLTGHYPNRYSYNSVFPYTIDDSYDEWQIRFLSTLSEQNKRSIVIRDYHRSGDLSQGAVQTWAAQQGIQMSAALPVAEALKRCKIAIQTVPQTTYLETIVADHPTLCYWNPDANMIRTDLLPFYDALRRVGVLHDTPESAANKLNEIASDPFSWWSRPDVREAVVAFRENVCFTAPDALAQWGRMLSEKIAS